MINYLNIHDIWDIIENGYVPKIDKTILVLTNASNYAKRDKDNAVNIILNSISESVAILFSNMKSTIKMWNTLLIRYEWNSQIQRTKLTGLEIKFENFRIEDGEP
jgi:hypothetical protein